MKTLSFLEAPKIEVGDKRILIFNKDQQQEIEAENIEKISVQPFMSNFIIHHNLIVNNTGSGDWAGGIYLNGKNCKIIKNQDCHLKNL